MKLLDESLDKLQRMLPFEIVDVLDIVRQAAEIGREMQGRCGVQLKPDNTFVTEADAAIETFLREKLAVLTPSWSFFGEEQGLTGDPEAPAWIIDPIDGTNNFVRGLPLWTVSLGAVHAGKPIFGVVAVPPLREMYWAAPGTGVHRERHGEVSQVTARDTPELIHEDIIACNTEADRATDFSNVPAAMRNFGSVAYHLAVLASGSVAGVVARWHKLYDVAGGMMLCLEAGCEAIHMDGREWVADITAPRELTPLIIAPPQVMKRLQKDLRQLPMVGERTPAKGTS